MAEAACRSFTIVIVERPRHSRSGPPAQSFLSGWKLPIWRLNGSHGLLETRREFLEALPPGLPGAVIAADTPATSSCAVFTSLRAPRPCRTVDAPLPNRPTVSWPYVSANFRSPASRRTPGNPPSMGRVFLRMASLLVASKYKSSTGSG